MKKIPIRKVEGRSNISEKIGYSGEPFRSGNEEGMYSNILRDLLNNYEFQDKKIQVNPESLRLVEQFKDGHEFQRRLGTLENVFDREMKSQGCHPVREKQKIFKVREFCKKSGKISVLVKVSEKSGIFLEFRVKSQGIFSKSREKRKEIGHEDKNIDRLQKKLKLM